MGLQTYFIAIVIAFVAAFVSGSTAVGGAALMTFTLTVLIGGEYTVPVLTIVMLFANLTRAISGFKEIDWKSVRLFLVTSLPLSLLGALGFTLLSQKIVNKILGVAIIMFVIIKHVKFKNLKANNTTILSTGAISGFLSGFVGSSGPISAALFFSLGLSPVAYVASEAAAVSVLHIAKLLVYNSMMNINFEFWIFSIVIGGVMLIGTVVANKFINKLNPKKFETYVSVMMIIMGIYMILN